MIKLKPEYFQYFENIGTTYHLKANQILYMQGDPSANIYFIKSGRIRMFFSSGSGKEITVQILGEGQLIGEAAFLSYLRQTTIYAVTDAVMISCSVSGLLPFMKENQELNMAIVELLADNYRYLCNQVRRLTMYDSKQKVASFLLDHTKEDKPELGIIDHTLPYTHDELAVCLNLNRVTVTRILNDLAEANLIELYYRKIRVIDFSGLEKILKDV